MSERYSTNYRIIYDNDKKMTLEEVVERLNHQDVIINELTLGVNDNFNELIGLMTDNNLTWKAVVDIIKEALDESI